MDAAKSRSVEPAEKAGELKQALNAAPSPWAPPKTSEALVPTSMDKPPPATEAPIAGKPEAELGRP